MINSKVDEAVLSDLKHLLIEAKQKMPPFLASIQTEADVMNEYMGKDMINLICNKSTILLHFTKI